MTKYDQSILYGFSSHNACSPRASKSITLPLYIYGIVILLTYYPSYQFVLKFLIQLVQRRFFHPLRSIPGPWINSMSELPATLALVKGNQHIYYRSLHEKYGPVVRVSPDEVSFVSVDAREEIYGLRVSKSSSVVKTDGAYFKKNKIKIKFSELTKKNSP